METQLNNCWPHNQSSHALCRSQEAAKKQCRDISDHTAGTFIMSDVQAVTYYTPSSNISRVWNWTTHKRPSMLFSVQSRLLYNYNKTGHFAIVWQGRINQTIPFQFPGAWSLLTPSTKPLQTTQLDDTQPPQLQTITQVKATELASTIDVCILTFDGLCDMLALPDSGADISDSL